MTLGSLSMYYTPCDHDGKFLAVWSGSLIVAITVSSGHNVGTCKHSWVEAPPGFLNPIPQPTQNQGALLPLTERVQVPTLHA